MTDSDDNDLRLLATFHYVVAAFAAFFGLVPFIHLTIGVLMVSGKFGTPGKDQPPEFVGYLFIAIAIFIIVMAWSYAGSLVYAARCLTARRRHTFCLVVGGVSCMFMPFGTILGVFTIVVLNRPSVRALFA